MGGKITGAIAAIAVSSATASVVGAVYTGFVSVRNEGSHAFGLAEQVAGASLEKGVILDATKGSFAPLPELPSENTPPCQGLNGPRGCVLVSPAPDFKLSFFGYTVTLPADLFVSDGEDAYRPGEGRPTLELITEIRSAPKTDPDGGDTTGAGNSSRLGGSSAASPPGVTTHYGGATPPVTEPIGGNFQFQEKQDGGADPIATVDLPLPFPTTAPLRRSPNRRTGR